MMYARRDTEALGERYLAHVDAMTREGLHAKSDIAAELAWRDARIAELEAVAKEGRAAGRAEAVAIILEQDAETWPEDSSYEAGDGCTEPYAIGDTGDYGVRWVEPRLKALFNVSDGSPATSLIERLEGAYWDVQIESMTSRAELSNRIAALEADNGVLNRTVERLSQELAQARTTLDAVLNPPVRIEGVEK